MCCAPNEDDFYLVVAMCHGPIGEDFSLVVAMCHRPKEIYVCDTWKG